MNDAAASNSIGDNAFNNIRSDIIFGRLDAGAKLKLDALKARYGTSVSTLREALSRLTSEGFIVAEGQRGFFVSPMSEQDLREISDLRVLLESHAMKLSFEAGDTEWEGRVVAAHHKLSRMETRMAAGDFTVRETWKRYDWEFHQALILACGSQALLKSHGTVFDKYLRYQMRNLTYRGEMASQEHGALLDAALARDIDKAQALLAAHIEGGIEHSLRNAP
ncbi:GntR family transcriptional regulator [Actibacterium lipolyticum]|uniref:HTH-type transcriptional repressor CsiR n=1 Tax=Actibacterium lipolyticum TaxID=1524263 RepID=A0A238KPZ3_9RHOB|nr:GntR family transcriptional regulator [Actibacterium lipolyticum]SMX44701.1 HTH-type transcriptional repressor CsiR [Actibacterium lipolyticum]